MKQYVLRVDKLDVEDTPNYRSQKATVSLFEYGKKVAILYPEKRVYKASQQPTTEVSIRSTLKEDLYLVFSGGNKDGSKAIFQVYYNPLVMWVWIGGIVLGLGTLIALLPNKKIPAKDSRAVRTQEAKQVEVGS
jgi:cytochrome c-type biogenesis protein CcmF